MMEGEVVHLHLRPLFLMLNILLILPFTKDEPSYDIAIDTNRNIYLTGKTRSNLDENINTGSSDAFLTKYDDSLNREWTKLLGTTLEDTANSVAIDADNNIYITGYTGGDMAGVEGFGGWDIFLLKYNSSGELQ